jgi:hypothetical protein
VQLITHTTSRTVCEHTEYFKFKGGFIFEGMEITHEVWNLPVIPNTGIPSVRA